MRTMLASLVLVGCGPQLAELDTSALEGEVEPAAIAFVDLEEGMELRNPVTVRFRLSVADQAPGTVPLTLSSSVAGELWSGNVGTQRATSWSGELPLGDQTLTLVGVDRHGATFGDQRVVTVRGNEVPTCQIIDPTDGAAVRVGVPIRFSAEGSDPDGDDLTFLWRSSLDGSMAIGPTFVWQLRRAGEHVISVQVDDPFGGRCVTSIVVTAS